MERENQYTLEDIAKELGISKTTVSRAISGKGRISQTTRDRVDKFIRQHNYQPNVMARGLAQRKTYNLGLVLPKGYADADIPFFKECMTGICEMALEHDYDIVISMADEQDQSQIQRQIANRKVDGIILSRSVVDSSVQKFLKENKVPFVVIGTTKDRDVVSVDNQNEEASRELTELMLMKGMKKLALLGGSYSHDVTRSRLKGFLEAHEERDMIAVKSLVFTDIDSYVKAVKAVEQALEIGADGILCMDDLICNMALGCLRDRGIKIPEQMRLASFYDSVQLEHNVPSVTSLRFDTRRLGKAACGKLLRLLGEEVEEETEHLSYQLILRESTK